MGQGYSLTTLSAGSAGIDVPELSNLSYEKSLGDARFMKTIRARHPEGSVVAKIIMKPYTSMELREYIIKITHERNILNSIPNALPYHRAFETSSNGYLLRQYVHSSLYDRMSTRPFLGDIEKRWIAFQLLTAVRDTHAQEIFHGDIKTENVLVTSWDWAYLSDFSASFKPIYLPEDNPADFSFYFDISGRRTCYLAPERFVPSVEKANQESGITWAMDIFSTGCVVAELFLETPIFNLSQLYKYKEGDYDPVLAHLDRIDDPDIRDLIIHMIQVDPESRYSADEYLNFWRRKTFPEYFYTFLHQYMYLLTDPRSGQGTSAGKVSTFGDSDERIDRVYYDFDKITYFLGHSDDEKNEIADKKLWVSRPHDPFPLHLDIPNKQHVVSPRFTPSVDDGTLLFLNLVTASLRSTAKSTTRLRACELLLAFAERCSDDIKLDRILPFVMVLLSDRVEIVRVAALKTLTQLMALVSLASPINAYLFPEYIMPKLEPFASSSRGRKSSALVPSSYATCLAALAENATKFLDVIQSLKAEGSLPSARTDGAIDSALQKRDRYDVARAELLRFFEHQTTALLTDPSVEVRCACLTSVSSLCLFFGSAKSNDVILTHLNTYLNDRDWRLKCAFFDTIVGVATYVGGTNLEDFILPLMIPSLTDPEEAVVERVLRSLSTMAQLGLFESAKLIELIELILRFTMHPNIWLREAATCFLENTAKHLSIADIECVVKPRLTPYMKTMPACLSETHLLDVLKKPLSRASLDIASMWASKSDRGLFWKAAQLQVSPPHGLDSERGHGLGLRDFGSGILNKYLKNEEDAQWIKALRNVGMSPDDDFKLLALRDYVWTTQKLRTVNEMGSLPSKLGGIIPLKDLGVTPLTVFFEHDKRNANMDDFDSELHEKTGRTSQTVADTILDASSFVSGSTHGRESSSADSPSVVARHLSHRTSLPAPELRGASRKPSPVAASPGLGVDHGWPLDSGADGEGSASGSMRNSPRLAVGEDSGFRSSGLRLAQPRETPSLRQKSSAIELMHKKTVIAKAMPETGMSSTMAFGRTDGIYSREPATLTPAKSKDDGPMLKVSGTRLASHSYQGNDRRVLDFLDSVYTSHYPVEIVDFGPTIVSVKQRHWETQPSTTTDVSWRPKGTLVARFGEHTASITRVVVAPDHSFFITGSEDGSVKVWDSARLERNLANRARQTYKHDSGSGVTSLCFIQNTHCFVSGARDGAIHLVRTDFTAAAQGTTKYGKLKLLRRWTLAKKGEHAVWIEHYTDGLQSTLLVATNMSEIHAVDLRTMDILYTLSSPVKYGSLTCFCVDPGRQWLVAGTTHGVVNLWDLRFRLRVRSWAFPAAAPIHRICNHPVLQKDDHHILISGGTGMNDVTIWSLHNTICTEVYRTTSTSEAKDKTRSPVDVGGPINITTTKDTKHLDSNVMLKPYIPFFPDAADTDSTLLYMTNPASIPISQATSIETGIRALAVGSYIADRDKATDRQRMNSHGFFVAAGGPDSRVRFWDMGRVEASRIVSGLDADEVQPGFTTRQVGADCVLCQEMPSSKVDDETKGKVRKLDGSKRPSKAGTAIPISQRQSLEKSHFDAVTDVALLEYPFNMVISVDRSGSIYVMQ